MPETKKKGVLLVNLGTPDSPSVPDVRKYLREFLMDERVIDIPFLQRWLLVNLIICPFRSPKSAKLYKELWNEKGSSLLYISEELTAKVEERFSKENYVIKLAMRYQSPSIEKALAELKQEQVEEIIIVPLFPHYASASTGSVIEKVNSILSKWLVIPNVTTVNKFFEKDSFIKAWVEVSKEHMAKKYDHYVFSYHGLPERQMKKASVTNYCQVNDKCCATYNKNNKYCYRAQCFENTRLFAEALGLKKDQYSICFQSRLGKEPWIQPYAEDLIHDLAKKGHKKVLAFSPAFVADCLETTLEVAVEFRDLFIEAGGEQWDLVPSLNTSEAWVDCVEEMIKKK